MPLMPNVIRGRVLANQLVDEYVTKLSGFIPEFAEYWRSEDSLFNDGDESTVYGVFSEFSELVSVRLEADQLEKREGLFEFIEGAVTEGGDVANAACTCFLENILNRVPESIDPKTFVPYLGKKSREFCKAWDEFTGVYTDGLNKDV